MSIYNKDGKEDPGTYRPASLTSVLGKDMEQTILSAIMWHKWSNQGIRPSQHGFGNGRLYLTNLICFYDKVTHLVDEKEVVIVFYLDFSKAFNTNSPGETVCTWLGQLYSLQKMSYWAGVLICWRVGML
ncbi:hypothetical protein DUI87_15745 [Hirundo rustica rustica]|uniref:Uncharacterized protein n=1 Tax=Hirundo rustica rustica TaxID=333673 RepID=A0A3M0K4U6_HIRRU|nr:hypothetical protein DUI87_15745 [Hirundo rustica rustica]